ncbi:MAG: phosphotransferase [Candidatus Heimdallarchaeaceae archaeon]
MNTTIKETIEVMLMEKIHDSTNFTWEKLELGLTNTKYLIKSEGRKPLAVCKIYSENEIFENFTRLESEKQALKLFGGKIAPELIWANEEGVLVYKYVEGRELNKSKNFKNIEERIKKTIDTISEITREKRKLEVKEITEYYYSIYEKCKNSKLNYPEKLLLSFENIIGEVGELIKEYEEEINFIHGDLVPTNLIVKNEKITLIDWEFFRPELSFFDYEYFNYYAKKHNIPISISKEKAKKEKERAYRHLIKILNDIYMIERGKKLG